MNEQIKKWIDGASYEDMLREWRFALAGDPMFQGETGEYFKKTMQEKKNALSADQQVRASKKVGWEKPTRCSMCGQPMKPDKSGICKQCYQELD